VQQAAEDRAAQRDSELESQSSPLHDPQQRIAIWERLHALRLPRTSGHVLIRVIAKQTGLTVGQVHEEQQRRAGTLPQPRLAGIAHEQHIENSATMPPDQTTPAPAASES
jgi:hypothetical protein